MNHTAIFIDCKLRSRENQYDEERNQEKSGPGKEEGCSEKEEITERPARGCAANTWCPRSFRGLFIFVSSFCSYFPEHQDSKSLPHPEQQELQLQTSFFGLLLE